MALLLLLSAISFNAQAQRIDHLFKHVTTENGLISNDTKAIAQDHEGYIWVGTFTGLQRFDGKRCVTYLADIHDTASLQSDYINAIMEDSRHRLWVATLEGAYILDRNTGKFYNFNLHLKKGQPKISGIGQFLEDRQGTIWLAAANAFYRLNENSFQFESVNEMIELAPNELPATLVLDNAGDIWFGTTLCLKKWSVTKHVLTDRNHNPGQEGIFNMKLVVANCAFDQFNNIWISSGFERILYRYEITTGINKKYTFSRPNKDPDLFTNHDFLGGIFICSNGKVMIPVISRGLAVYDYTTDSFTVVSYDLEVPYGLHLKPSVFNSIGIMEDRERNVWITTNMGLNILSLDPPTFTFYSPQKTKGPNEIHNPETSDFLQTADGDIFVSNYFENGGMSRYNKHLRFKEHYSLKRSYDILVNQLWSLYLDEKGIIWGPTQRGNILQIDPYKDRYTLFDDSVWHGAINQIQRDENGDIWLGTWRKGLVKIDGMTRKAKRYMNFIGLHPLRRVNCFLFDGDLMWVGTGMNGLQVFNKRTNQFTESFTLEENNKFSISSDNVTGILAYNKDTLILSTLGGINIFDKRTKKFTAILSKDGLPSNLCQSIILDDRKNVWAAFSGGFSKINIRTKNITNFDISDGIIDQGFNNRIYRLQDGRFMVSNVKGFMVFDPNKVNENPLPPNVTITRFKLFDQPMIIDLFLRTGKPLELAYTENNIQIEFATLQFRASNKLRYYYQLEGADKEWQLADAEQTAHYNKLPPGNYMFLIRSANQDGVFSKHITRLEIHIIPPVWKRWWFMLLAGSLIAFLLFWVVKYRERSIRKLESSKTNLQQLTAEKYKNQFESEQVSNFFSSSLLNKNDVDDVLWDVAKNLIGKLGFVDCMIYLWNDDKTMLHQKAGYGLKGSLEEIEKQQFNVLPGQGVVGTVATSGEALLISDTSKDPRYRVDDMIRLSELCVPIKYNHQVLGVIDSEHFDKNFFTRQHLQVLTTIATLVGSKIRSIESEQKLRHQKAELADINQQLSEVQLAALRSQMNPHFIFNALNSIKKFVIANEPDNAEKYLGKFSKLIRTILDNSQTGMVTVEKELQLLKLYLDLEQLRSGTKLNYEITVDENIDTMDLRIPSMVVQPFVENAMLHGIMHREDGGRINISFNIHGDRLEVIIEDNGVGRARSMEYKGTNAEQHRSIGIEVTTKRLQALKRNKNTPAGVRFVDLTNEAGEGTGTKVIISIPIY